MRRRSLILGHGIAAAARLGLAKLAWQWFQDVDWKAEGLIVREEMLKAILEQVPATEGETRTLYTRMCDAFLEQEEYVGYLIQAILAQKGTFLKTAPLSPPKLSTASSMPNFLTDAYGCVESDI